MKMAVHARRFLPLICLLVAFNACRVNDIAEEEPIFTGEPEYAIDLFEQRDSMDGSPTFGLWVERLDLSPCEGYGVDATAQVNGSDIEVAILGLQEKTPCVGDSAPAKRFVPIGNLPDGTYTFSLSIFDVIENNGSLTVTNGRYTLSLPNAQGVFIENFILEPLPDGIIWGYAATPDEASQPVADNFIADLKALTTAHGLAPGFYSYFTVSGTGDIILHKRIAPKGPAKLFLYKRAASPDVLRGLLQNYRDSSQQPLTIKCWTTQGEL